MGQTNSLPLGIQHFDALPGGVMYATVTSDNSQAIQFIKSKPGHVSYDEYGIHGMLGQKGVPIVVANINAPRAKEQINFGEAKKDFHPPYSSTIPEKNALGVAAQLKRQQKSTTSEFVAGKRKYPGDDEEILKVVFVTPDEGQKTAPPWDFLSAAMQMGLEYEHMTLSKAKLDLNKPPKKNQFMIFYETDKDHGAPVWLGAKVIFSKDQLQSQYLDYFADRPYRPEWDITIAGNYHGYLVLNYMYAWKQLYNIPKEELNSKRIIWTSLNPFNQNDAAKSQYFLLNEIPFMQTLNRELKSSDFLILPFPVFFESYFFEGKYQSSKAESPLSFENRDADAKQRDLFLVVVRPQNAHQDETKNLVAKQLKFMKQTKNSKMIIISTSNEAELQDPRALKSTDNNITEIEYPLEWGTSLKRDDFNNMITNIVIPYLPEKE